MTSKLKGFGDLVNYLFWIGVASWVVFRPGGPVDDIHKYFEVRFGAIEQKLDAIDQKAGVIEWKLEQNFPNPTREGLPSHDEQGRPLPIDGNYNDPEYQTQLAEWLKTHPTKVPVPFRRDIAGYLSGSRSS
jgi:hypothetical protein